MENKKHVIVSGGGLSSLGKGIVASSLGSLLASTGKKVALHKCDPYLNYDPSTMNPMQHGEVYVTDDGCEADLDLGNYERFLNVSLDKRSSVTSGMILQTVLDKERAGDYNGATAQVVPHVTDEVQKRLMSLHVDNDIVITELGGTLGDIEGIFLTEGIRLFKALPNVDVVHVHVAFVPYLATSNEHKTKPAQQSIREAMRLGFPPDIVICRSDDPISEDVKTKVASAAGLPLTHILNGWTVDDVYSIPLTMNDQKAGELILGLLGLEGEIDVQQWDDYRLKRISPRTTKSVAICGKYVTAPDAYKSVIEAVKHAGVEVGVKVKIDLFDVETHGPKEVLEYDAVIIPGGYGERGWGDKITISKVCRENNIPLLGICLGFQAMVVDHARNVNDIPKANSTEFRKECVPVIEEMDSQKNQKIMGGTQRLGACAANLLEGSKVADMYGTTEVSERHRHRRELKTEVGKTLEGLVLSGLSEDGSLVEFIEKETPGFWIGCQGHPELKSRPMNPHPLFLGLLNATKTS